MATITLDLVAQLKKWRELNEWIKKHFSKDAIAEASFSDIAGKFEGQGPRSLLFYGFGDNGAGQSDPLLTGHIFVTYLTGKYPNERSRYVDFYPPPPDPARFDFYRPKVKMRDGAAARPKGFYIKEVLEKDYAEGIGATYAHLSPGDVRKLSPWGWGPEGFQFLAVEEGYVDLLIGKKVTMFTLGDYAIAPYGESDYYSTVFLGTSRNKLEIGVTNARDNIAKYAPSHFI